MRKLGLTVLLLAFALPLFAQSVLELMLQGRFGEAKQMINHASLSPRYELLYYAMTESDAARACSLYQVIAIRYASSDCDRVARDRLDQARSMGYTVVPIAEWAQAPANATPLFAERPSMPVPAQPSNMSPPAVVAAPSTVPPAPVVAGFTDSDEEPATTPEPATAPVVEAPKVEPPATVETPAPVEPPSAPEVETPAEVSAPVVSDQSESTPATEPSVTEESEPETGAKPLPETLQPHDRPAAQSSGGRWYVQVGAFANEGNANKLASALQNAGFTVKLVPLDGKTRLLQVRVGGYKTRADLASVMTELKSQFKVPTAVVAE